MITDRTIAARTRVRAALPAEADLAFRRRVETIIEWIDPNQPIHILDCGSGYGFVVRILRDLTDATITGIEYELARVQESRESLGPDPRITLQQGDAMHLDFADDTFDVVVCSEVLEHLPDDARAARELYRVLKPGGSCIVTVPCQQYPFAWDPLNWLLERTTGRHLGGRRPWSGIWYDHQRLYSMPRLEGLMTTAGFDIEETRGLTHYAPPFAHLLLYGIAKPLLRAGLAPESVRKHVDRHETQPGKPGSPVGAVLNVLNWIDRKNDDPAELGRETGIVGLAIRAHKPGVTDAPV